ncbi:MAG TPA: hypothetical protein VLG76_02125 [Rhabdochlamydiaceae bacterium]|nr:hypothetical protein [Rhabdochlamydiaceae bacterium]
MGTPTFRSPWSGTITFSTLIKQYIILQSKVVSAVRAVASKISQATPGKFLLLQFQMGQVTQIGESISNLVSQIQASIMNTVRNQKSS